MPSVSRKPDLVDVLSESAFLEITGVASGPRTLPMVVVGDNDEVDEWTAKGVVGAQSGEDGGSRKGEEVPIGIGLGAAANKPDGGDALVGGNQSVKITANLGWQSRWMFVSWIVVHADCGAKVGQGVRFVHTLSGEVRRLVLD